MSSTNRYELIAYLSEGLICPKIAAMSILGEYLKTAREQAGLTQVQVANMLGVQPHNYTPFETGTGGKLPDEDVLPSLASFLKADLDEMCKRRAADAIWHRNAAESVLMAAEFVRQHPEEANKAYLKYLEKRKKDEARRLLKAEAKQTAQKRGLKLTDKEKQTLKEKG